MEKNREDIVSGSSIVFTGRAVVDETFFQSLQTYANLLMEMMPLNYIPTRCVNPCPPVFIRDGFSVQKRVDSHLDKTRHAALKNFNEQD